MDKTCKNSCINSPAAIAAVKLYRIFNDSTYLDKAKSLYSWEKSTLFDFGTGVSGFRARVAVDASAGGSIEIRRDSLTSELLGTCSVSSTGGWTAFATVSCPVSSTQGVHDLYLVFKTASGKTYVCNLNWFTFGEM